MKKFLPYILIVLIVVQLFAPFTIGRGVKNGLEIQNNKAEATSGMFSDELGITVEPIAYVTSSSINLTIKVTWVTNTWLSSETVFVGIKAPNGSTQLEKATLSPGGELIQSGNIIFSDLQPGTTYYVYIKATQDSTTFLSEWMDLVGTVPHTVGSWIGADEWPVIGSYFQDNESTGEITNEGDPYEITTLLAGDTSTQTVQLDKLVNAASFMPVCDMWKLGKTFAGCIGMGLYHLIFVPTSYLFAKTGQLLDFTVGYSVRDQSYRSSFVVEGWGVVRDFCNMFFIFILLYIAFGTILKLNGVKTKEMIINVVIIGLLINFSLFATQVIIDASNILTRVFYNSQTIKVGPKVDGVIQNETGPSGEIKLSEALVAKINPQNLIINASNVEKLKGNTASGEETAGGVSAGTFILVVVLASAVNIVGLVVFLICALLFITRVIGLWLAMIFAPLAFFSYAAPKMQEIDMIGWKKWWPETLKLAFMAPVFMFFMYLIIKFLETGLGLSDASNSWGTDKMDFVLKTFVPFIFIMILLLKAKSIAVKMSGKMGEAVSKVGAAVAGIGLAAATGGAAMAMRGTLGKAGSAISNNQGLKNAEAKGGVFGLGAKALRNIGGVAGKGSFDVRATQAGASASKGLGVDMSGKGSGLGFAKVKEGGFEKNKAEQIEKRQKRAKELEVGEDSAETQTVRQRERELNEIKTNPITQNQLVRLNNGEPDHNVAEAAEANMNANPADQAAVTAFVESRGLGGLERYVATRERAVAAAERTLKDATDALLATDANDINARNTAQATVDRARRNRDAEIRGGTREDGSVVAIGRDQAKDNLERRQAEIRVLEGPIHTAENALKVAENNKIGANRQIRQNYANSIQGNWSNAINLVISGGQHSVRGEREAANKILAGIQEQKK